ncbi:MAG: hypothetical protein HKN63_00365 [Rhodobacteraceae bacterium]|nr:hypothetical protein [Paracoccaceae bacterium]
MSAMAGAPGAVAATFVPDFDGATFRPGAAIDHPYFPLDPTFQAVLSASGMDEEGEAFTEETQLSFGGPGRVILGVQTTVQRDLAFEDGLLVEDTFDYYAQDTDGNVWYMGEDVTNYIYDEDDNLIETNDSSAWIAGENGASPGWIMPAVLEQGFAYFQEIAPGDAALDEAMIWSTGQTVQAGGVLFEDVLAMLETTSLDPEAREFKYYAPGAGLIRIEEGLDESFSNPELVFERVTVAVVPLPASLPMLLAALAVILGLRRLRSHALGAV